MKIISKIPVVNLVSLPCIDWYIVSVIVCCEYGCRMRGRMSVVAALCKNYFRKNISCSSDWHLTAIHMTRLRRLKDTDLEITKLFPIIVIASRCR